MSNNGFFIISAILGLGIPAIVVVSSVILLIVKIIERMKEKKNEDFDKYDKYWNKKKYKRFKFLILFLRIKETMI